MDSNTIPSIISFLGDAEKLGTPGAVDKLCSFADTDVDLTKLPQSYEVLRGPLQESWSFHKHIESMADTFMHLADMIRKKLDGVKKELRPAHLHCGIQMLPDETLSHIFEDVVLGKRFNFDPEVRLSHVCSRFRSVALGTPSLWRYISSRMSLPWIDAHLERSKNERLIVGLYGYSPKAFERTICHAPRWRNLYFDFDESRSPQLSNVMEYLDLPSVEKFECYIRGYSAPWKAWKMPNVRYVNLRGSFELLGTGFIFSERLTKLVYNSDGTTLELIPLATWLASIPNLTDLTLTLQITDFYRDDYPGPFEGETLFKVTDFTFGTNSRNVFEFFMKHLRMPILDTLAIELDKGLGLPEMTEKNDWGNLIRPEPFVSVRRLRVWSDFDFEIWGDGKGTTINGFLLCFPNVESLSLDVPSYWSLNYYDLPALRSLSIKRPDDGCLTFIKDFIDKLKERGRWGTFETLEVVGVKHRDDRERAEKIVSKEKLKWVD